MFLRSVYTAVAIIIKYFYGVFVKGGGGTDGVFTLLVVYLYCFLLIYPLLGIYIYMNIIYMYVCISLSNNTISR